MTAIFTPLDPGQHVIARGQVSVFYGHRGHTIMISGETVRIILFWMEMHADRYPDLDDAGKVRMAEGLIDEALEQRGHHWLHRRLNRYRRAAMLRWYGKAGAV